MAGRQREISVSEFFLKNRHLLGFDTPAKALVTAVKEAVDNALDACELGPALRRRPALDETFRAEASGVFWGAVGKEVGFSLVRESPVASWTRVAWMTHTGAEGQYCPGARFLGFFLTGAYAAGANCGGKDHGYSV